MRQRHRALPVCERKAIDAAILRHLFASDAWQRAGSVFAYAGTDWEIDTWPLLERAIREGKRLLLPKCQGPGIMGAVRVRDLSELHTGYMNLPEPQGSERMPPESIDLCLVPCIATDRLFMRLGQGGGFYDRYLPGIRGSVICLCRTLAVLEKVPADPWDVPVEKICTEKGFLEPPGTER
ncbi:MAG: 5-formyltetrahydrofolate cyclo-ligase [Clostridia bacterium]|nr:5-formyltetrahydrofolate cyclo-ligase [Clostridia bacterium]